MQVKKLYTGSAAQQIDRIAIDQFGFSGFDLMNSAGEAAFAFISNLYSTKNLVGKILVLCGAGNNGGDGYIVARYAIQSGMDIELWSLAPPKSDDAKQAQKEFHAAGGDTIAWHDADQQQEFVVIVDAVLGTGLTSAPSNDYADAIRFANDVKAFKFALDVPSGLDADTGCCFEPCFIADATMSFIVPKLGLLTGAALDYVGELSLAALGVTEEVADQVPEAAYSYDPRPLPSRERNSHKGNFGHALIVGGYRGMLGAALLAGEAALRAGAGKVTLLSTKENLDKPAQYVPELMSAHSTEGELPEGFENASAIGIGPGLGFGDWSQSLFEQVLSSSSSLVLDADALTLLAGDPSELPQTTILTPHPGEAAKLIGLTTHEVQVDRLHAAKEISQRYNCICVLKGAGTLIAHPSDGLLVCAKGNPAMATAGMGDVLTGIITALLAQGLEPFRAAYTGVWLHAAAADDLVYRLAYKTLLASDVAKHLSRLDV